MGLCACNERRTGWSTISDKEIRLIMLNKYLESRNQTLIQQRNKPEANDVSLYEYEDDSPKIEEHDVQYADLINSDQDEEGEYSDFEQRRSYSSMSVDSTNRGSLALGVFSDDISTKDAKSGSWMSLNQIRSRGPGLSMQSSFDK